jgi:hypothetical protein
VAGLSYVLDGAEVVAVPVSPKSHAYLIASPSGSAEPALLNWHTVNDVQLAVNVAVGALLPAGSLRVTLRVVEADLPQPSVVVNVIV